MKKAISYKLLAISRRKTGDSLVQDQDNLLPFVGINKLTQSFLLLGLLACGCNQLIPPPEAGQNAIHVQAQEVFRLADADNWLFRTPGLWKVAGESDRRYLQLSPPRTRRPTLPGPRRPQEYAIYKPYEFRSFSLSCFVRVDDDTNNSTRDACIIFGRQDDTHFYYVHLSDVSDATHNTIMRVAGSTRQAIIPAIGRTKPVMVDSQWHKVDILRNADTGLIQVFVDARDEKASKPYLEATDKAYEWGFVGLGSFDHNTSFARILVEGEGRKPIATPTADDTTTTTEK